MKQVSMLVLALAGCFTANSMAAAGPARPNVLLVITDDQGYGDLGCHGNPKIRTPNLDAFAQQSVHLRNFFVSPVCAPTRASLMTGRYNYRTGVVDTYLGRALMCPDEVTLAEMLTAAGYRTGIFGKWHLGDNYPLRALDQGFQEALVLKGGGIGQPSDLPGGSSYFDPVLLHNGRLVKTKGYCSDVFTDAAIRFVEQNRDRPFFAYLAYNAPHTPLQVPDRYYQPYKHTKLTAGQFPAVGQPLPGPIDEDATARVYGMVTNIDDNLGRLFARLDDLRLADNTIVLFLTDNGPQQVRYTAGLRGRKGSVYDGGIRVPCYLRWPGRLPAGKAIDRISAHIDLAPTLLEACGVQALSGVRFDGKSLLPLLKGTEVNWTDRTLYFQWHRGDEPELYRACAARSQRWKLVQPQGANPGELPAQPRFELYDMAGDPYETTDVSGQHPALVERMRQGYEAWFRDVRATRGFAPPRITLGTTHENPTIMTRQDWRGPRAGWGAKDLGYWEVQVAEAGSYEITLHFAAGVGRVRCSLGTARLEQAMAQTERTCRFDPVWLEPGSGRLEAAVVAGEGTYGVDSVEVRRVR
jgi:arylsulfatase A-like enzyme